MKTLSNMSQFNLQRSSPSAALRFLQRGTLLLACSAVLACGVFGDKKDKVPSAATPIKGSPEALYKDAKAELDSSAWTQAIEKLDKVQAADALGIYGQQAMLDTAYAQWRNTDTTAAIVNIERYMKQFPKGEGMAYALYLKGLINFNERSGLLTAVSKEDLSERDPKTLSDAYDAFSRLLKDYPQSTYAAESNQRLTYIVNTLAKHEIGIALFYLQRGAPLAAANRAQGMLTQFSQTPAQEEALGIMAEAYRQMNLLDLRDNALRVLKQNYPSSRHLQGLAYTAPTKAWYKLW